MQFFLVCLLEVLGQATVFSQTTPAASSATSVATLQSFQQQQLALAGQRRALVAAGATPAQIDTWYRQNAAVIALQQQRAQALALTSTLAPQRQNKQANIPANASPALTDFLNTQAALSNACAHIHNQFIHQTTTLGAAFSVAQVKQLDQQANQLFLQQNSASLTLQNQRARALAVSAVPPTHRDTGVALIPPNASPQLAAYLTAKFQLKQELAQLTRLYINADPATRQAAIDQWYQAKATQLAQLRQLAQNLTQASIPTSN